MSEKFVKDSYITTIEKVRDDLDRYEIVQDAPVVLHKNWEWYFGRFDNMEQLNNLAKLFGFTYELEEERNSVNNGVFRRYKMSHNIVDATSGGFWKISTVPETAKKFKALSNGSIVDCYFLNDGENIVIYRPNPNAKTVYNPLSLNDHIRHVREYGSY